ncbi:FkbM family methyltransferase [Bacteroides sp.]|uniref:FkbM family methyltransferase n=1 Tax=Bacteroides sp. TaxID=29523 RepID=UPI0025BCD94D|nr:FkbM family methyltransferase [Bacteroides sp.]
MKQKIRAYYSAHPSEYKEINEALSYMRQHKLCTFPSPFIEKYNSKKIAVQKDPENGLLYVIHEKKKLYFRRSYNPTTVRYCYCGLITEQDADSPHCYTDSKFKIENKEVLFDIGSAEGIFVLSNIEKIGYAVLFEKDKEWVEALEATFAPWAEKITIVPKYVSDHNDKESISIDSFCTSYPYRPDFIKIDVEGAEQDVLNGMEQHLETIPLKIALCTYHKAEDHSLFCKWLSGKSFKITSSKGVMIFLNDIRSLNPPYFRKGLIRAYK